jgi:hypothetical protein
LGVTHAPGACWRYNAKLPPDTGVGLNFGIHSRSEPAIETSVADLLIGQSLSIAIHAIKDFTNVVVFRRRKLLYNKLIIPKLVFQIFVKF